MKRYCVNNKFLDSAIKVLVQLTFVMLVLIALFGCASQQRHSAPQNFDEVNAQMRDAMPEMNRLSKENYGVECLNDWYIAPGAIVMDIKNVSFNHGPIAHLSIDNQLKETVKMMRSGAFGDMRKLNKLGIHNLRVLIDGRFYKEYNI